MKEAKKAAWGRVFLVGRQKQRPGSKDELGVSYTGRKEASAFGREGQGEGC